MSDPGTADAPAVPEGTPAGGPTPEAVELAHILFDYARAGEAAELMAYIDAGVPVDLTDAAGNTLLMLAAHHGHADTVTCLLERGADANRLDDRGRSPLAGAIVTGADEVAHALVYGGADPDAGTPTARESAHLFGRLDLLPDPDPPPDS